MVSAQGAIRKLGLKRAGMREIARGGRPVHGQPLLLLPQQARAGLVLPGPDAGGAALGVAVEAGGPARGAAARDSSRAPAGAPRSAHGRARCTSTSTICRGRCTQAGQEARRVRARRARSSSSGRSARARSAGDAKLQTFACSGALNWAARWYDPPARCPSTRSPRFVPQLLKGVNQ